MSHQKRRKLKLQRAEPKKHRQLNGGRNIEQEDIVLDIRQERKDYKGLIELQLRKLHNAYRSEMPTDLKPMLATLSDEPFNDEGWQFELKLDGYRAIGYIQSTAADLRSRKNNSFRNKFAPVVEALMQWGIDAVVDGEVVVTDNDGIPDFNYIQQWDQQHNGHLIYYVFDLLWLEGFNIMEEPLHIRREILKQIVPESGIIRFSDHINETGISFFEQVKNHGLEGIIAKRKDAPYQQDMRTQSWLKIKSEIRHEAIICGYTKNKNSDRLFSSLILGRYEEGRLIYLGQAGTGFTASLQKQLRKEMKPIETTSCPFGTEPRISAHTTWLKPFLLCEVKYTELTPEGLMRHASFKGLRTDKTASDYNVEQPEKTIAAIQTKISKGSKTVLQTPTTQKTIKLDGHKLKLTNLNKIYWPEQQITKRDMLRYYYNMAEMIMPYMKDRPQSLNRFPDGIHGQSFYQKDMKGKTEKWMKTFSRFSESAGEPKDFLICNDTATLLFMANLGCIEMNPWHSKVQTPFYPDWCVIDLDPGNISFDKVIETALVMRELFNSLHIPSFPKTSGSTGMHIYLPLGAEYNYEQAKQLAEIIAHLIHEELPAITSMERNPEKRKDKIYLDYLQNRPIQTICAPYSLRPKAEATVSAPLHWDEVKKGLQINQFTIKNMYERVKAEDDLFKGVLGKGIDLNKVLKTLSSFL